MRQLLFLLACFFLTSTLSAQTAYQFNLASDTVNEPDGTVLVGYIKASQTSAQAASFQVVYKNGTGKIADINNDSIYTIAFPANMDSVPFSITITNDSIVEKTEKIQFTLRSAGTDSVGIDSVFNLYIKDDELPATFQFLLPNDSVWEYVTSYDVKVVCNNPNATGVRVFIRVDDANCTAIGGQEFGFFWQYLYFKPGQDTAIATVYLTDDNVQEFTEQIAFKLSDFDANICTDSAFTLFILDDESPQPISLSFTSDSAVVFEDTVPVVPVYLEVNNPWSKTFNFRIVTVYDGTASTADYAIFYEHDPIFLAPPGISYDTVFLRVKDDTYVEDTETAYVRIKYDGVNTASDSVFSLAILDRDTVHVGFLGAGYSYLEGLGRCSVKLVTTSPMPFPISVPVSYYDGNALAGVDFTFVDTVVTFPANSMDTQQVFVNLIDDNFKEVNEQVNLRIGNSSPAVNVKEGVRQFSFFIIDNDSLEVGIDELNENSASAYPNPFSNRIHLVSEEDITSVKISSTDGKLLYSSTNEAHEQKIAIDTRDWDAGIYVVQVLVNEKSRTIRMVKAAE